MPRESISITCRNCDRDRLASDFYKSATECIECKKDRSRRNRMAAARKLVLAERLLDLLTDLINQGWRPSLCAHGRMSANEERLGAEVGQLASTQPRQTKAVNA
ncbi:hypothetical protein [Couchioplanes caeruleus]|uniref:Uncharacterized protein n=1 Tax=Couchioplanes caeruleus TaxID=56438 RepID=A0A3N1FTE5_9ACTN|nr:hypothetical protein [Couchioplanes caeruleus]ROP21268.1 hypothetical protein EDD30_7664 [Couchioplanes caeruleus]